MVGDGTVSRPSTPNVYWPSGAVKIMRVKRFCNGCDREVGDVTEAEMDAAVAGLPLPDVREECGCIHER